jgi:predicted acylesterase/phospholipase RssA
MDIGLALSGGGFRATLFHLGVIDTLRQQDKLRRVTEVCGVSGGAIIAAELVRRWTQIHDPDPENAQRGYEQFAGGLIALAKRSVRNRVLRGRFWRQATVIPSFFAGSSTGALLESQYATLFSATQFTALPQPPETPRLAILSTSLITGQVVAFESDGVRFWPKLSGRLNEVPQNSISLARAVAASAAFPILSTPIELPLESLGLEEHEGVDHLLTDGGVFDNVGAYWLAVASSARHGPVAPQPLDMLMVSDAGRPFEWSIRRKQRGLNRIDVYWRNMRANDLLMWRLAEYDLLKVLGDPQAARPGAVRDFRTFSIADRYQLPDAPSWPEQQQARRIRTDLNRFSDREIELLRRHGRSAAFSELSRKPNF